MSLEAFIWAAELPLDELGSTPFRVLLKLANHAHKDGRNAWRTKSSMASELGCSDRTVQRAFAELEARAFIVKGDQRLVEHLRGDRRPVVWDLNFRWTKAQDQGYDGETADVSSHGETNLSRGDNPGSYGETTVVAQGTVIEPTEIKSSRGNHTGDVPPCPIQVSGHTWTRYGSCAACCMTVEQLVDYWASRVNS